MSNVVGVISELAIVDRGLLCLVASLAVMVYDHLLTLASEIQFVWKQDFSGRTVIFFINRYFSPVMMAVLFAESNTSKKVSSLLYTVSLILQACIQLAQGLFDALRIYATWNRCVMTGLVVFTLSIAPFSMTILVAVSKGPSVKGISIIIPESYATLDANISEQNPPSASIISFIIQLTSNTLVAILTWIKTAAIREEALRCDIDVRISTLLLRDGTIHYA
ncbi:hypothetical protein BDY19DRAFT_940139 [Irpex rosettiformis]|uniref:Uncharacterized protein n=1 Tax=Irpex rosettiformis TaxID=378272 RepID=A0ACB8U8E0_9APHY|nr:hypothetical protein BDY19DRAFT_940139 [Irpex rosettiformis]